jgi:glycerophosphoryl diester phosphodiesterase
MEINKLATTRYVALRGLSGYEKENTVAAFIAAGNRSYYGIEGDLIMTKDNVFVICHEKNTQSIAPINKIILDSTYKELLEIPLYEMNTQCPKAYLRIPTLKDLLFICKKYRKRAFINLKCDLNYPQIQNLLDEIEDFDYLDKVVILSSNFLNLKKIRDLSPTIYLQYGAEQYREEVLDLCLEINAGLVLEYQDLKKQLIDLFHHHNLEVNAWAINDETNARELETYGIDYITTSILE